MSFDQFLPRFRNLEGKISEDLLTGSGLKVWSGELLNSLVLKIQKPHWVNPDLPMFNSRLGIFFSIWLDRSSLNNGILHYNIHALKLREFKNYKLQSRPFAEEFRVQFKKYQSHWPNIKTDLGPLTLMMGWDRVNLDEIEKPIQDWVQEFLLLDPILEQVLTRYKKK